MLYGIIFLVGVLVGFRLGFWFLQIKVRKDSFREKYLIK